MASGSRTPTDCSGALERALANAPALIDVVTSQDAVSSDAKKGLGFVPDYQALSAWDEAERKRRAPQAWLRGRPWTPSITARSTTASPAPSRAGPSARPTRCRRCAAAPIIRTARSTAGARPPPPSRPCAGATPRAGYGLGHRVAILFAQRPEFFFHYYALNALGCSVVPINPDYRRGRDRLSAGPFRGLSGARHRQPAG